MRLTVDLAPLEQEWGRMKQHFPSLPDLDQQVLDTVYRVAQAFGIPPQAACGWVALRLLTAVPQLLEESVEAAKMSQPAAGWRDLKRKVKWQIARAFARRGAEGR